MAVRAIINMSSGSVPSDAVEQLRSVLQDMGHEHDVQGCAGEEVVCSLDAVGGGGEAFDNLIVWGGDGSIACALERQKHHGMPVLALPGGTMNLMHKAIHGEYSDWKDVVVRALGAPNPQPVSAGVVAGRRFYVGALFGKLTHLAEAREAVREGELVEAISHALSSSDILDLAPRLDVRSADRVLHAADVGVFLDGISATDFEVGIIAPNGVLDLTNMAFEAMLFDWRTIEGVERLRSRQIQLSADSDIRVHCTLDGEVANLRLPLDVTLEPDAGTVLQAR